MISGFAIFALGLTIAGVTLGAEYAGDYILALVFGMIIGYATSWPANVWLVKRGIKVPM